MMKLLETTDHPVVPYRFYAERRAVKRHPLAYITFGGGPRYCIGMRFVLMEMKMTCIHLLQTFTILKSDKLENQFHISDRSTIRPQALWIKLECRKKAN